MMTPIDLIIIMVVGAIGAILVIGAGSFISKMVEHNREEERNHTSRIASMQAYEAWVAQREEQRRRQRRESEPDRDIADVQDVGRAGVCDVCGLVSKVQKCCVADKTVKLCNDCLYKNKQEREQAEREAKEREQASVDDITKNMSRISYESGYQ